MVHLYIVVLHEFKTVVLFLAATATLGANKSDQFGIPWDKPNSLVSTRDLYPLLTGNDMVI